MFCETQSILKEALIYSVLPCSPRTDYHNPAGEPDWTAMPPTGERQELQITIPQDRRIGRLHSRLQGERQELRIKSGS